MKDFLDERGITPYRFGKDVGLAQATAYNLYNDPEHLPSIKNLKRICEYYKVQTNLIVHVTFSDQ
ncbi:helix-turn-helix transcriptional regulator [Acaryochloris sp. CCMEE 5410]|uniref:helix-turn-helix domain-containing protein n=1 Tax=Acaryochloris sp. CCMEE 5410 TaxID=310037 RepID=UPI0008FFC598|nr:helix-turn-helix transcriptional regulator [Acaryochloris sp. CCMEE 5410]KAI9129479.1 helix-turn-helix transcriptional regulator [Acaryochloris sp. CCMEE 5410]